MRTTAISVTLILLLASPVTADEPQGEGAGPAWVVIHTETGSEQPSIFVELTTASHGYTAIFMRRDGVWAAPVVGSTTTRLAGVDVALGTRQNVGVDSGSTSTITGSALGKDRDVQIVLLFYGDVQGWKYTFMDVTSFEEVARGNTIASFTPSQFESGHGMTVETLGPAATVASELRTTQAVTSTGFGFFGSLGVVQSKVPEPPTLQLDLQTPSELVKCPCIFYGDEGRPNNSFVRYPRILDGEHRFRVHGAGLQELTAEPLIVLADIPDVS